MGTIHGSGRGPLPATALAIAATTLAALAAAPAADAAVTCSYDQVFKLVKVELDAHNDGAALRVNGSMIVAVTGAGAVPCPGAGGPPTVDNTNAVVITDTSDIPTSAAAADGTTSVTIDDPARFAPGSAPEKGGPAFSEIEFQVTSGAGEFDALTLRTTDARDDAVSVGTGGINWNVSTAEPAPDAELTHSGVETVSFRVGGGDNLVQAQGGEGVGTAYAGPARLLMVGEDGVDLFTGGTGADILDSGAGDDTLAGDVGEDILLGGAGDDTLLGGPDSDHVTAGPGADTIAGGAGANDIADFISAPRPVIVDLNLTGPQDTGAGNDVLTGVEHVFGSVHADTLIGDAAVNSLFGDDGDDTLAGGPGDDRLDGARDVDTVTYADAPADVTADLAAGASGGGGSDFLAGFEDLVGSPFADDLSGDDGSNTITGLGGADRISALGGSDTVNARDGEKDTASCGSGSDLAFADRQSAEGSIDGDCEIVDFVPEAAIADPPAGGAPDTAVGFVLRGARSQRVLEQKGVIVKVRCPLEGCTARARGTGRLPRLQRARGRRKLALTPLTRSIRAGETRTLKLRLAKQQRRALRTALAARKRPKLSVTVRVTDAAGNAASRRLIVKVTP